MKRTQEADGPQGARVKESSPVINRQLIRCPDDTLLVFEHADDARRVVQVLPLRLVKFGLRLNAQKTRLVPFGKRAAWRRA
jgi:hypothetical protein